MRAPRKPCIMLQVREKAAPKNTKALLLPHYGAEMV